MLNVKFGKVDQLMLREISWTENRVVDLNILDVDSLWLNFATMCLP